MFVNDSGVRSVILFIAMRAFLMVSGIWYEIHLRAKRPYVMVSGGRHEILSRAKRAYVMVSGIGSEDPFGSEAGISKGLRMRV